jgi:acetyltransferase-like isoleucine patch superfamily enzyme
MGHGAYLHRSVQILGKAHVKIGSNTVVSQDSWLNVNHRDGVAFSIDIGNNCFIGRRNFFSSGRCILFGDFVLTANDCQFLGSSHVTNNPMQPVLTTGTTNSDVIIIGSNCFIGAGVQVVGSVSIGHGCVIGAGSLVTRDMPPFSQAHGCPAVIGKRFSFLRHQWVSFADFSADDERAIPTKVDYLVALEKNFDRRAMPYIASGSDMGNC